MDDLKYRPDIDGLRALAILLVVGYHAAPGLVPGGFVGVDVFFVISGYLITGLITRDLARGRFSLRRFFQRRIRRLFPALLVTTATGWGLAWWILWPDEFARFGSHLAAANGFVANLLLWREAGYFDPASASKPLLHLWSLGIEEQFYLVWPLTLLAVWPRRRLLPPLAVLITVLSLAAVATAGHRSSAALFYLPVFRAWELMLGCLLATLPTPRKAMKADLLAVLGLGAIMVAAWGLDRSARFPGPAALLPTGGTILLLAASGAAFNRRLLAARPLVWLGLISYPWYLWHWLLISYGHIVGWDARWQRGGAVLISLVLAGLTHRLLERPLRRVPPGRAAPTLFAASLALLLLGLATQSGLIRPRQDYPQLRSALAAAADWNFPEGLAPTTVAQRPAYLKEGSGGTVLFWGDSHLEQYAPRIVRLIAEDPGHTRSAVFVTMGGCPPLPHVQEANHPDCTDATRDRIAAYARSDAVTAVVVGFTADYLLRQRLPASTPTRYVYRDGPRELPLSGAGREPALAALGRMLAEIAVLKPVYLILDNPIGVAFDPLTRFQAARLRGRPDRATEGHPYSAEQAALNRRLREVAAQARVQVIDVADFLCDEGFCPAALPDGTPIYKDASHLRPFFVRDRLEILDVTVRKPR